MALVVAAALLMVCCGFACSYFASQIAMLDLESIVGIEMGIRAVNLMQSFRFIRPVLYFVEVSVLVRQMSVCTAAASAFLALYLSERFADPRDHRMVYFCVLFRPPHSEGARSRRARCPSLRQAFSSPLAPYIFRVHSGDTLYSPPPTS
jgi:hypothetical protein